MSVRYIEKSVSLYMREGSSDKEYHLHLRMVGAGWSAYYANGPRGRVGAPKPIKEGVFSFDEADKLYEGKLKSKLKSGYTPSDSGVRFANTEAGRQASSHVQQLPTAVDEDEARLLMHSSAFVAQEKANGERRTIEVTDGVVRGINKLGLYVNLPEVLVQAFSGLQNAVIDGEQIGVSFHAFDLLALDGQDLRRLAFSTRYEMLEQRVFSSARNQQAFEQASEAVHGPEVYLLRAARTPIEKAELLYRVRQANGEGVVFKHAESSYEVGRSRAALKYKFCESSTCVVQALNDQRSVRVGLRNAAGDLVSVGNVTIPANFAVPAVGDLVEVQYLYYNPEGAFEQPVYLGARDDIRPEEAVLSQVTRLKPGVSMDSMGRRLYAAQEGCEPDREPGERPSA